MFQLELHNEQPGNLYKATGTKNQIKVVIGGLVVYVAMSVNMGICYERTDGIDEPQVEYVHKIISKQGSLVLQDIRANWKKDIEKMADLQENWDEEGAHRINSRAISNAYRLFSGLDKSVSENVRLFPTPLGAVMIKLDTEKGRLKGEIGDQLMSYFVKRPSMRTEHHSFEEMNSENVNMLKANLTSLI